jgi:allantoinase
MLKLPGHNRYDYSPIVKRSDYAWPHGKRLAFYIALNIEHFAFGTGIGMDPSNRSGAQTSRNFAWRDYGNRIGNWRLFEILDELKLPATILLNSMVCYHYPEIVEKIKQRGDDVLGHGRTNAELLRPMWEHDEARAIQECTEVIEKHVGMRPTGWMGPGALESNVTPDLLKEAGYTHLLDWPGRRPADLDAHACRPAPVRAVSHGTERCRDLGAPRSHRARIRRHDRRSI